MLGVPLTDDTFVIAQADGSPLQPRTITHQWYQLLANNKALPRIRFHDLRHAHATHMLSSGVHPKIASERLGHSKVGITMDYLDVTIGRVITVTIRASPVNDFTIGRGRAVAALAQPTEGPLPSPHAGQAGGLF